MEKLVGLRRRLTYANVIATLALFFALTGGAMAGAKFLVATDTIPPSSDLAGSTYGNPQIANGKVTTNKIADGAVSNGKLQNSTLSVNAGTGLTGGGSVALGGSTSLAVADGGIGTNQLADGSVTNAKLANPSFSITAGSGLTGGGSISLGGSSSLSVDPTVVQSRVTGTCSAGSAIASINQNGSVGCQPAVSAFASATTGPIFLPPVPNTVTVVSKIVPAGTYVIFAKAVVDKTANGERGTRCDIDAPGSLDFGFADVGDPDNPSWDITLPMQATATLASATTVTVDCGARFSTGGTDVDVIQAKLMLIPVGSVQ
jgi:hypothetical protein